LESEENKIQREIQALRQESQQLDMNAMNMERQVKEMTQRMEEQLIQSNSMDVVDRYMPEDPILKQ